MTRCFGRRLLRCLGLGLLGLLWALPVHADVLQVRHYQGGYSAAIKPYLEDILRLLLELSRDPYGDYELVMNRSNLTSSRAKAEVEQGELINVHFSASWSRTDGSTSNVASLEIPLFNNILGLRELFVAGQSKLQTLPESREAFLRFRVGQGIGWEDVQILENAGIKVTEAPTFEALFPMLQRGRFDVLPLSVLEIDEAFATQRVVFTDLKILPSIYLYYPMAINLNVNKRDPRLVQRIELGISRATKEKLDEVFHRHFPSLRFTQSDANVVLVLDNPLIAPEINARMQAQFREEYGQFFKRVF